MPGLEATRRCCVWGQKEGIGDGVERVRNEDGEDKRAWGVLRSDFVREITGILPVWRCVRVVDHRWITCLVLSDA